MSSTSKYSGDTAIWSTGNLLDVSADLSAVVSAATDVSATAGVGGDDAATAATDGWAVTAWSSAARRGSLAMCDHHRVARPHAGIHGRGGKGTSQKYGGADQEESRCADLDGDQGMSCATRTRVPRHVAAHRPHQFEAGGLQRRHEPEEHRRDNRAGHQEHQHPPVRGGGADVQLLGELRRHRGGRRVERTLQKQPRDGKTACRRREREEEAFGEQLPDDAPA